MSKWFKGLLVAWWIAAPILVTGGITQIVSGLPFTLTNGTVADATQVMADFNQIVNNVNANAAKNGVNNDITALTALVTPLTPTQGGTPVFIASATGGGTANAQTIAATLPSTFALTANYVVQFVPGFTNTGTTTLNVSSTGVKNVFKQSAGGGVALAGGELVSGLAAQVVYDGVQYILLEAPTLELVNAQTGATYTYLTNDHSKLVTASNAAAQAYTLPQASATFPAGWYVDTYNKSTNQAGIVTITPTTSTIDGAATLVLNPGGGARIVSDGTNYQVASRQGLLHVTTQVFSANGTYNRRPGLVYAIIECLGAGGSGAGGTGAAGNTTSGSGGGAGSYSRAQATAAAIGASQTVTIGAGGTAPAVGNNNGNAGGDTSFGAICIGKGGAGGSFGTAGSTGVAGAGGVAGTGNVITGQGQHGYQTFGATITTINKSTPMGGSSMWGAGGKETGVGAGGAQVGSNATGFGAGGGGGGSSNTATTFTGGSGSGGYVIVTEFSTQ